MADGNIKCIQTINAFIIVTITSIFYHQMDSFSFSDKRRWRRTQVKHLPKQIMTNVRDVKWRRLGNG